jgi:hypothetical protein
VQANGAHGKAGGFARGIKKDQVSKTKQLGTLVMGTLVAGGLLGALAMTAQ